MNSKFYKCCAVPQCESTTIKTPEKLFIYVPRTKTVRKMWLQLARRDPALVSTQSKMYFCEDHFDLPNDMENYMEYHIMGSVSRLRLKPSCLPSKFSCHQNRSSCNTVEKIHVLFGKKKSKHCSNESAVCNTDNNNLMPLDILKTTPVSPQDVTIGFKDSDERNFRQPHLRQKWIEATGRTDWEPTSGNYICSEHFRESDYETVKSIQPEDYENPTQLKRILKRNAIPTLQLGKREKLEGKLNNSFDVSEIQKSSFRSDAHMFSSEPNLDLSIVKDEPNSSDEFSNSPEQPSFAITSAITVKEENEERQNGRLNLSHIHLQSEQENSQDFIWPKRQKHQDSLIAPEDVKVEAYPLPPCFNSDSSLTIEEKYERLLNEFFKLRRDYDLLKFKFDKQSDAINRCEIILSECT